MKISANYYNERELFFVKYVKKSLLLKFGRFCLKPRSSYKSRLNQNRLLKIYYFFVSLFSVKYNFIFLNSSQASEVVSLTSKDQMFFTTDDYYMVNSGIILFFILQKRYKKIKVFYDIGSNIGFGGGTLFMITRNSVGKIYSFDPNQEASFVLKTIIKQLSSFKFKHRHFDIALDKKESKLRLDNSVAHWSGYSRISNKGRVVKGNSIDNMVKLKTIELPDFIKIDAEEYEFNILTGAKNSIKKNKPEIFFENSHKLNCTQQDEIIKFFIDNHYEVYTPGFISFNDDDTWVIEEKIKSYKDEKYKVCFIPQSLDYMKNRSIPRDLNLLAVHKSKIDSFFDHI